MKNSKKIMKRRMRYRVMLLSSVGFDIDVENKINRIELSNRKLLGNYYPGTPEEMRLCLLSPYLPQYTNYNIRIKSERSNLAGYYRNEIDKLLERIEEYKLVIQLCSKSRVTFKEEKV